jgi:hypothetical protein
MITVVTSLLMDKPPLFQQACFSLHFTVSAYFVIEHKTSFIVSMLFCVKHILIICIHFVLLIKSRSCEQIELVHGGDEEGAMDSNEACA